MTGHGFRAPGLNKSDTHNIYIFASIFHKTSPEPCRCVAYRGT